MKTPASLGFWMPAEWEEHKATWIAWPHNKEDWPGKFQPIPWVFTEFVRYLSSREDVRILLLNKPVTRRVKEAYLRRASVDLARVTFYETETDRFWLRDSGPIFLRTLSGERLATLWRFNAWAKYKNYKKDEKVAGDIAMYAGVKSHKVKYRGKPVVLEGGAIDVDGAGRLMAMEECLLSTEQERNPGISKSEMEKILKENLGVREIIWLSRGIVGDDTHGHIDDVARFVAPGKVLLAHTSDGYDPHYKILYENYWRLNDHGIEIIDVPMPSPLFFEGQQLPASYLNFYIANGIVLVPTFNDQHDHEALGIIRECFPGREVVGIHSVDLVWGLGTLHCMTQQEPK